MILKISSNNPTNAKGITINGKFHPKKNAPRLPIKTKVTPPLLGVGFSCELLALGKSIKNLFKYGFIIFYITNANKIGIRKLKMVMFT